MTDRDMLHKVLAILHGAPELRSADYEIGSDAMDLNECVDAACCAIEIHLIVTEEA
jgi:hypothetical protein